MICEVRISGEATCTAGLHNQKTPPVQHMLSSKNGRFEQGILCS